jgi:hypothetical protein
MSLAGLSYADGSLRFSGRPRHEPPERLADYLNAARQALDGVTPLSSPAAALPAEIERLRWFLLPAEVPGG